MAAPNADMAQFFDFGEAAMPDACQQAGGDASAIQTSEQQLLDAFLEADKVQTEEFNTDFSSWLPGYQKPANPCDYCRSRSLECFIYNGNGDGTTGCSPCRNLFRPCSFSNPELMPYRTQRTALDTLDVVGEDDVHQLGGLTRRKQLRSKGHIGPIDDETGDLGPKKGAAAARFPRAAVKILKDWMLEHQGHPYPTEEEKEVLGQQTGLSAGQISNWMANTRRRQKARPKRSSSPSIRPNTQALNIPAGRTWESLNPFERWKHSPPENEPAPLTAIAQAVETFDLPETTGASSSYQHLSSNKSTDSFSVFRAPSLSSLETGFTNMSSGSLGSHNTAYSHGSKHSLGSMNSLKSKERRRRRRVPTRAPKDTEKDVPRLFQCTFCTDRFKSKYDWSRHEKSLHLSLEKWICAPLGEIVADTATGKSKCVYCGELEPTKDHLATHNHSACEEKGLESRTFYRKDHLRQHLRLMHDVKMTPAMDSWVSEAQYIKSRCGFCAMEFTKWQDRVDHLSKEFRNGANMKDWKGCRGLDASVAVHVTNAMPPYLIANESKSPFPFSASETNTCSRMPVKLGSQDLEYLLPGNPNLSDAYQYDGQNVGPIVLQNTTAQDYVSASPGSHPHATCWEILTLRLGRFARQHIEKHGAGSVSDEMLQKEARIFLYGEPDDPWHQTAADNPEWLNLFKKAHGIDHSIQVPGIHSQHEIYEDLGLGASAKLDPSFDVNNVHAFGVLNLAANDPTRAVQFECSLAGTTAMYELARHMSTHSPSTAGLTASTSASPTTTPSRRTSALAMAPITEQTCTASDLDMSKAMGNFHIPSWDQLPAELQDPATSSGFESTIPLDAITSTFNVSSVAAPAPTMAWDEHELSFDMDMDLDFATEMANAGMS